jgi:hypothetical protein
MKLETWVIAMPSENSNKLMKVVFDIAAHVGVKLSHITITEGKDVGCLDTHLLTLHTEKNKQAHVLVYQSDIDALKQNKAIKRLEKKISSALSTVKTNIDMGEL